MKKAHLKIVLVTIFAALLSGCTWLNTETQGGISRGKLIVGMVAFGAGIGGIVHSDSASDDTILPARPRPPRPVVGIATSDSAVEGGEVTLTISSDLAVPATLTDGLTVTIDISGADATDFTSGDCTNPPRCIIVIPSGMTVAELSITASNTDTDTIAERWTAAIAIPANGDFAADPANDVANFIISETATLPTAMNGRTLAELNAYTVPTPLAVGEIRAGGDERLDPAVITGSRYNDADGNPQVYVQMLTYAHLGIWTNGQVPTIITLPTATASDFDHDFRYAFLGDNAIPGSDLPTIGGATYALEGDATYKGVNFFLDGSLGIQFTGGGNAISGSLSADGDTALDDYGSATARVRDSTDVADVGREIVDGDDLNINFLDGTINADGTFSSTPTITAVGAFFSDLNSGATGTFAGRFYDAAEYDSASGDPSEIAGAGMFADSDGTDDSDNLHFGFLGRCTATCAAGD